MPKESKRSILGVRPTVVQLRTHVEEFFFRNRSRSKAPVASPLEDMDMKDQYPFFLAVFGRPCSTWAPEGSVCNAHSWALRRLVSVFARTVRRPHVPREPAMRQLYLAAGVPLPEGSLQNTVWEIHSTVLISSMAIHFLKICFTNINIYPDPQRTIQYKTLVSKDHYINARL